MFLRSIICRKQFIGPVHISMKIKVLSYALMLSLTGCGLFSPCDGYDPVFPSPIVLFFTDANGENLVQDEFSPSPRLY